jgi:uncharacterized protein YndB with AHSA1/START domain
VKDVLATLGTVTRSVEREGDHDGPGGPGDIYVVEVRREYDAEPADVWDACTDPERVARWFGTISGDLRLGGRFAIEGNASGEILECDAPRHLHVTWEFGGDTSWVTLDLRGVGTATELTVRHRQPRSEHWATFGPGATGVGWDLITLGLGQHLGGMPDPRETFAADPDASAFIRGAAAAWGEAHEKAGAPAAVAARAAQATADAFDPPQATNR